MVPSLTSGDATNDWSGRELELVITSVLTDTLLPGLLLGPAERQREWSLGLEVTFSAMSARGRSRACVDRACAAVWSGEHEKCVCWQHYFRPRPGGTAQGAAEARRGSQRRAIMSARGFLAMFTL